MRIVSGRLFHGDYLRGGRFREDCRKADYLGETSSRRLSDGRMQEGNYQEKLLIEMFIFSFYMESEAQPMSSKLEPKPGTKHFNDPLGRFDSGLS
jgi:hypothetical protein